MKAEIKPGRRIMGRLAKGADLLGALEEQCRIHHITVGEVWAIGAVTKARVGYYKQDIQKYMFLDLNGPMEILTLIGNVSLKDGQPMVHAHVTLSDEEGRAFGGHLAAGTPIFACEFVLQECQSEKVFSRALDEETGLFLWAKD
jgi:predicted DNA-binding protein with PD1-like motif